MGASGYEVKGMWILFEMFVTSRELLESVRGRLGEVLGLPGYFLGRLEMSEGGLGDSLGTV